MKSSILKLIPAVFAGLLVMSCSDKEPVAVDDTLTVYPEYRTVTFSADGETLYAADGSEIAPVFSVETTAEQWYAEVSSTWCSVQTDYSANTFTLKAVTNESTTETPESATVTITAGNAEPIEITVSQMAVDVDELYVTPEYRAVTFSADGTTLYAGEDVEIDPTFTVSTSADSWTAETTSTWCTIEPCYDNNTFTISAEANTSDTQSPEDAVITVSAGNAESIEITVSQKKVNLDIYVAGYIYYDDYEAGSSRVRTAGYWKNGEWTDVAEKGVDSYVRDIRVVDGDIYISGGLGDAAGYWKNGEFIECEGESSPQIYEMQISEAGDVYTCGYDRLRSCYWKNGGEKIAILTTISYAYGMWVNGEDLHFVGVKSNNGLHWTVEGGEGEATSADVDFTPYTICIDGDNTYIAGYKSSKPYYSVNGETIALSDNSGSVNKVRVLDGKVVMTGTGEYFEETDEDVIDYTYAACWIDGVVTQLTDHKGEAIGVTSWNGDIYVAGTDYDTYNFANRAVYWKNGEKVALNDSIEAVAKDIAVVAN